MLIKVCKCLYNNVWENREKLSEIVTKYEKMWESMKNVEESIKNNRKHEKVRTDLKNVIKYV